MPDDPRRGVGATSAPPARGRSARVVAVVALVAASMLMGSARANADNGVAVRSTSRYVLDSKANLVRARLTMTIRNALPSVRSGNSIHYYYLPYITIPVPADAAQLKAVSNGQSLTVTRAATKDPSTAVAKISFPSNLLYGQSRSITVTFVLKGEKPRSKDQTRVGPGYATFAVLGVGDRGQMTVQVVLPASMTFDATTDLFTSETSSGLSTYTATGYTDSSGFLAVVSARDPALAKTENVTIGGQDIAVMAYPDDPEWASFVSSKLATGIPALEKIIGADWPGGLKKVREDRSVNVRGFDGWFDTRSDEIVIGEELEPELLYHELTHAWATSSTLDARWMYEGIADAAAERAVLATGGKPAPPPKVSRTQQGAVALNSWQEDGGRAQSLDDYGYPASRLVVDTLLDGCDPASVSAVLGDAVTGRSAYAVAGQNKPPSRTTTWQRFLDLLQIRGGNTKAPGVLSTWVLTPKDQALLAPRAKARTAYAELDQADGGFVPPLGLREAMTGWDFTRAQTIMTALASVAPKAVSVQQAAKRNGMAVPAAVAQVYEGAETDPAYAALADLLPRAAATIDEVGGAERAARAARNPLGALGAALRGVDGKALTADRALARADFTHASTAARAATSAARFATLVGLAAVIGLVLLLVGIWWALRALRRRLVSRRSARRLLADATAQPESDGTGDEVLMPVEGGSAPSDEVPVQAEGPGAPGDEA